MERRYTSEAVAEMAGVTLRQLQWWDEQGIVVPEREGRSRSYSADDLAEIAVISEMRKKGFSLQRMRKVLRFLQKKSGRRLLDLLGEKSDCHLLTDGKRIFLEDSAQGIVDVLRNSSQPIFSVCLSDAVRQVEPHLKLSARPEAAPGVRVRRIQQA